MRGTPVLGYSDRGNATFASQADNGFLMEPKKRGGLPRIEQGFKLALCR
jgi:hypothetical protein